MKLKLKPSFKLPEAAKKLWPKNRVQKPQIFWGELFHVIFNAAMPFALVALISMDLTLIAITVVFLSKWRMFAVRMNHLPTNLRANLTDLIIQLSALSFMTLTEDLGIRLIIAASYSVWLLLLKPQSSTGWVSIQAMMSQMVGITALMLHSDVLSELTVLIGIWAVVYATTYHFLSNFDEIMAKVLAKIWALLGLQLAWLFLHWNLAYFSVIPQYALVQGALSLIAGDIYFAKVQDKLDNSRIRFYITATAIVVFVLIISADWKGLN